MEDLRAIEKQNRIVIARSLRKTIREALSGTKKPFVVADCTESVITQFFQEVPSNYEQILSCAVADIVIELSTLLRQCGDDVSIHARIKKRRSVTITVQFR